MSRQRSGPVEQNPAWQRLEWRFERLGLGLLTLFVGAAAAGVFGGGPLSRRSSAAGPLTVDYERLLRVDAPSELRIRLEPQPGAGAPDAVVWTSAEYLRGLHIASIVPPPARTDVDGDRLALVFHRAGRDAPMEVVVRYEPARPGRHAGFVGLPDGTRVAVRQFVFF